MSSTERNRQSPFLRLPGEIRNQIYEYALSGHVVMIYPGPRNWQFLKLKHFRCSSRAPGCEKFSPDAWFKLHSLGLVCRQLHDETKVLPYAYSTFQFHGGAPIGYWVSRLLSKQQRDAIQHVWFLGNVRGSFEEITEVLNWLAGLATLTIHKSHQKQDIEDLIEGRRWRIILTGEREWSRGFFMSMCGRKKKDVNEDGYDDGEP